MPLLAHLVATVLLAHAGPTASAPPSVQGPLQQGKKLTALTGTWVGSGTIAYRFQWYRCDAAAAHCSSIHGATGAGYTEVAKDVGHTLALTVHATDSTGAADAYASVAGVVAPASATLIATAQPPLAGDPIVGQSLSLDTPAWTGTAASTAVAWLRCNANGRACSTVAGASGTSYALVQADLGHTLVAAVTGTSGKSKTTVLSLRSGVVRAAPGPVATVAPSVTGTLAQGSKLTAAPGTWTSGDAMTFAYQWYRCDARGGHCSSIHGATKSTYTLVAKDVAHTIGLTVRATDASGTTPAYAPLAGLVAAKGAAGAAKQPALTGTSTLAVPAVSGATYAWLRCNANGRACAPIAGATAARYAVAAADKGHTVVASVTAGGVTVWSLPAAVPA